MDKRSLWIGLGSGMIVGAVLLQLATVGQNALSDSNLDPEQPTNMTKEQLETAAKSLDMKLVGSEEELYTEAEWVTKKKQESSELQGNSATPPETVTSTETPAEPEKPQEPATSEVEGQKEITEPKTTDPVTPNNPKGATVSFKVRSGNSLSIVAANLKNAGIVDDAQAFIKAGKAEKINTKIQVGTYALEKGESFNSIIAKITKEPSN
ncbi:hypothetical protein [Paenibacillus sp. SAF-068]|uniref:hypothetical protein n=1 Tax=Paenibacillus sp. SAF-068 TaxID=3436864 RepID=UPI003F7CEA8A